MSYDAVANSSTSGEQTDTTTQIRLEVGSERHREWHSDDSSMWYVEWACMYVCCVLLVFLRCDAMRDGWGVEMALSP
jgi:hypothetical protein